MRFTNGKVVPAIIFQALVPIFPHSRVVLTNFNNFNNSSSNNINNKWFLKEKYKKIAIITIIWWTLKAINKWSEDIQMYLLIK
jgi:hypothetical protein